MENNKIKIFLYFHPSDNFNNDDNYIILAKVVVFENMCLIKTKKVFYFLHKCLPLYKDNKLYNYFDSRSSKGISV